MLTIWDIIDDTEGTYKCTIPVAVIDTAIEEVHMVWEDLQGLFKEAEAAGEDPCEEAVQYKMGVIAGILSIADASEMLIPIDDDWSADPDTVNTLINYENLISFFAQQGGQWKAWEEHRKSTYAGDFLEQLQALDTEEESGDNEND